MNELTYMLYNGKISCTTLVKLVGYIENKFFVQAIKGHIVYDIYADTTIVYLSGVQMEPIRVRTIRVAIKGYLVLRDPKRATGTP
jgi:hypothetical protein